MPFPHKTVLITGATAGIGRALAERLLQQQDGSTTVIAVGRRKDRLDDLVARYGADKLVAEEFDVTDLDAIPAWADKITTAHPNLSAIILNAGVQRTLSFTSQPFSPADFAAKALPELTTNYTSPLLTISAFLPHLVSLGRGGAPAAILVVTSGLALVPLPRCPNYCATKAALHHLAKSLRYQLQNDPKTSHVRVVEILPPAVQTELHALQPELVALGQANIGMPLADFIDEAWEALDRWDPDENELMVKDLKKRFGHLEDGHKVAFEHFMETVKAL